MPAHVSELTAGCDLLADRREAFTTRHGVKAVYADFHEMLAQEELDLVAICTPASGLQKPLREAPEAEFRGDSRADLAVAVSNAGNPHDLPRKGDGELDGAG